MNLKRQMFCEYYLGECKGNAEQAAIKAGYKPAYARSQASRLLTFPEVREYIENKCQQLSTDNIANIEDVQAFWTSIMRDEDEEVKNRLRASELLAKAKGAFNNDW